MKPSLTPEQAAIDLLTTLHFARPPKRVKRSRNRQRDHRATRAWGWYENILGIGVGEKQVKGQRIVGRASVTFFVRRKLAGSRLLDEEKIPETLLLESIGQQVTTDLIRVVSAPMAHASPGARIRPIQPGIGIGHWRGVCGSLGLLVRKKGNSDPLALGCSHILARSGDASTGDPIEQPFTGAPDTASDRIGALSGDFSSISGASTVNTEDMALATIDVSWIPQMVDTGIMIDSYSPLGAPNFQVGTPTVRNGVGTQSQTGQVSTYRSTWTINDFPFVGTATFAGLVSYTTVCGLGDSGAAVLMDGTTQVLGIHIAGSSESGLGLFYPIGPILEGHDLELVTQAPTP